MTLNTFWGRYSKWPTRSNGISQSLRCVDIWLNVSRDFNRCQEFRVTFDDVIQNAPQCLVKSRGASSVNIRFIILDLIPALISNHNPSKVRDEITFHFQISTHAPLKFGIDKSFHHTLFDRCDYFFMLILKLTLVSKWNPWPCIYG